MAEEIVWRGHPSQWRNFGRYLLCALLGAVIIGISTIATGVSSPEFSRFSPFRPPETKPARPGSTGASKTLILTWIQLSG